MPTHSATETDVDSTETVYPSQESVSGIYFTMHDREQLLAAITSSRGMPCFTGTAVSSKFQTGHDAENGLKAEKQDRGDMQKNTRTEENRELPGGRPTPSSNDVFRTSGCGGLLLHGGGHEATWYRIYDDVSYLSVLSIAESRGWTRISPSKAAFCPAVI